MGEKQRIITFWQTEMDPFGRAEAGIHLTSLITVAWQAQNRS